MLKHHPAISPLFSKCKVPPIQPEPARAIVAAAPARRTGALNGTVAIAYPLFMATLSPRTIGTIHVEGTALSASNVRSLTYNRVSRPLFPLDALSDRFAMRDNQECVHV
ncbi:MAG: hypothetical protein H0T93_09740 [Chloroflexia bacterium]|nr:hypothetical protein [Chloroflexia bacterium]